MKSSKRNSMKRQVPAGEFKAKCLQLMDEVNQTKVQIVITKRGKPVAKLVPVGEDVDRVFGALKGTAQIVADIVAPLDEPWEINE